MKSSWYKRTGFSFTLSCVLALTGVQTSSAIFGLSKCEKVERSVKKEEQVGLIYWKQADVLRDQVISKPKDATFVSTLHRFYGLIISVYQSDLKVYKIVERNRDCFDAKIIVASRDSKARIRSDIKWYQDSWLPKYGNWANIVTLTTDQWYVFKSTYPEYKSIYEW